MSKQLHQQWREEGSGFGASSTNDGLLPHKYTKAFTKVVMMLSVCSLLNWCSLPIIQNALYYIDIKLQIPQLD
ncbi:hypothetical protein PRUPE_7G263400 [Prunus persica]|uniref:Uncharacterized protein n=1 Tax=Prunus persica TaxID=3760 RepID=A0A251NJ62_PRUPE|nr:hypothetical protein PRUPE_7G263400 [Prunus persica]